MASDLQTRISLGLPPLDARARDRATAGESQLGLLDPIDPEDRSVLILLAHPELAEAIDRGDGEVVLDGQPINPRLHLAIHEIVATQIIDGDPPEVLEAALRLTEAGRDPHEVQHMLGSTVTEQIWAVTRDGREYDPASHAAALAALPGSWDAPAARPPGSSGRTRDTRPDGRRRPRRR
jgi:hypothetical protein